MTVHWGRGVTEQFSSRIGPFDLSEPFMSRAVGNDISQTSAARLVFEAARFKRHRSTDGRRGPRFSSMITHGTSHFDLFSMYSLSSVQALRPIRHPETISVGTHQHLLFARTSIRAGAFGPPLPFLAPEDVTNQGTTVHTVPFHDLVGCSKSTAQCE